MSERRSEQAIPGTEPDDRPRSGEQIDDRRSCAAGRDGTINPARHLLQTLDHLLEGCMVIGRDWTYLYVNEASARHGQQKAENLIGRTILEMYPGVEQTEIFAAYRRCMEGGAPERLEAPYTFADGRTNWYVFSVEPVPEGIFVWSLDITTRVQAEQELRQHRDRLGELAEARTEELAQASARYRSLFNGMTEGFGLNEIVCDEAGKPCDWRFLDVNPAFERLTGKSRGEVVGRLMSEVLPGGDPAWIAIFGKVALTGESVHFDNRSKVLGRHFDVFAYRPAPKQFAALFVDVTEHKRLEKDLSRLASFPERNPIPITEVDAAGHVCYLNASAKAVLPDLEGRGLSHPWLSGFAEAFKVLRSGVPMLVRLVAVGESSFEQSLYYARDADRVRIYGTDVTERVRAESALKVSEERLRGVFENMAEAFCAFRIIRGEAQAVRLECVDANAAAGAFVGLNRSQLLGKSLEQILPAARADWSGLLVEVARTGQPLVQRSWVAVHGGLRFLEVRCSRGGDDLVAVIAADHSEAERARERLRDSEARYRHLFESVQESISIYRFVLDEAGQVVNATLQSANRMALQTFGVASVDEVRGKRVDELFGPERLASQLPTMRRVQLTREPVRLESRVPWSDRYFLTSFVPLGDDEYVASAMDITERVTAEEAVKKLNDQLEEKVQARTAELTEANRTLRVLGECSTAVARATDETALVGEICQIIHDLGGYRLVWVGYADEDAERTVRPIASVGRDDGFLSSQFSWADDARGRGPTGRCIRTGRVQQASFQEPDLAPWREEAQRRGYQSALSLPLTSGGRALGAITLYAQTPGLPDEARLALLTKVADDLGFGIGALRARAERDHARQLAEKQADQLRALAVELGQAETRERRRVAKVIHDHLQQLLAGAKFSLGALRASVKGRAQDELAEQLTGTLDEAMATARTLTVELNPPVLQEQGLGAGLKWLGRHMGQKLGLQVDIGAESDTEPAAEQLRVLLFEAVREMLFNVAKHAGVARAEVRLRRVGDDLQIVVSDSGRGFTEGQESDGSRFGLFSIRERLRHIGGRLQIDTAPGRGSRLTLVAPIECDVGRTGT